MKKLILMSGLPSSGRTSYIDTFKDDRTFVVETKELRKELTGSYESTYSEPIIIDSACDKCIEALNSGNYDTVVIDSSTLKNQRRIQIYRRMAKYIDIANLVIVDCDPAICIKRDKQKVNYLQRGSVHILESFRKFEEPNDAVGIIYDQIIRIDGTNIIEKEEN